MTNNLTDEQRVKNIILVLDEIRHIVEESVQQRKPTPLYTQSEVDALINQKEKELLDKFEEAIERVETQIGFDDGLPSDLVVFNQGQRKVIKQLKEELKERGK